MTPKTLIILLFSLIITNCSACYRHSDCSNSTVAGYCRRVECIPLSTLFPLVPSLPSSNLTRSTIASLTNQFLPLSRDVRVATIRSILDLSKAINVNTRLYKTIHGQSLDDVLIEQIRLQSNETSPFAFHTSLQKAITKFHDLHFRYVPPFPLSVTAATLGLTISQYYPRPFAKPSFILSDFVPGFTFPKCMVVGAHVIKIDDVPILHAIEQLGGLTYGSNSAAKFQQAVDTLTIRQPLDTVLPDKDFVKITVRSPGGSGKLCTATIRWIFTLTAPTKQLSPSSKQTIGIHHELPHVDRMYPGAVPAVRPQSESFPRRTYLSVNFPYSLFVSASIVQTSHVKLGILKVNAFPIPPDDDLVAELTRILKELPQTGLIVDIRDNLGGVPAMASMLTNMISNVTIPCLPLILRASKFFQRALNIEADDVVVQPILLGMETALKDAILTKEKFTGPAFDLNRLLFPNGYTQFEQVYKKPVVTLTSALSYSAGDIYAMLQKDLNASYVISVDDTTGGGGAGIVSLQLLNITFPSLLKGSFVPGADCAMPILRFFRSGPKAGGLVEHFGVEPHERYWRTKEDVLDGDKDLFELVAQRLGL